MRKPAALCIALLVAGAMLLVPAASAAPTGDTRVAVGSPAGPFAQNKQNEPGVAVNPIMPSMVAAGANDEIDVEACRAGDDRDCPFTAGVGVSGVSFSLTGGDTWVQPTYTGWTARHCVTEAPCVPRVGPIGTLPKYYENGLVADGDPSLAFGPRRGGPNDAAPGEFSWDNGYRLYYSSLASAFSGSRKKDPETGFKGFEAIAVSRTDDVPAAASGDESAWKAPVIASKQNGAAFSDHEQITVDDAASSPFFGNVYICYAAFRSVGGAPEPIVVGRSTDGGATWQHRQISEATNTNQTIGRQDCNIKTDSEGVVYVVYEGGFKKETAIIMARSFDGGRRFERPRLVHRFDDVGLFDPTTERFSFDGVGGARTGTVPWIDIANGAPMGDDATDEIVVSWNDGPTPSVTDPGPNERVMVGYSTNGARSFSFTSDAADRGDRPDFPAIGISPDGEDVYLVYDAFFAPWQVTTARARPMQGVVRHADSAGLTAPTGWADVHRGEIGDARGSSQNGLTAEFLGDYNNVDVTRSGAMAVWNDVRDAAACPAINRYRQAIADGETPTPPRVNARCPFTFGNSDIYGGFYSA